jgi:uncharacterized protein
MLSSPLPALNDVEGVAAPDLGPVIVDAHVHLFPPALFHAVWQWFEQHGWPIRYQLEADQVVAFLTSRGVDHLVALHYAHKPGVARGLNTFVAELCQRHVQVTGLATVFPGEEGAVAILEEGFKLGLCGVKLHAHVQCFDLESAAADAVYGCCAANGMPLVMHAGREPRSPAYHCDPHLTCGAEKVSRLLRRHPRLRLCVPHLGADEFTSFRRLLEEHDNLWLDTAMALAGYLPGPPPPPLATFREDRVMYGTDFPQLPYAWDRELVKISSLALAPTTLTRLLADNAFAFFGIDRGRLAAR